MQTYPIQVLRQAYHFHPHSVSTPWGPLYIHLTSIQVESHTRPNPNKCVSSPTMSPLLHIIINSGLNRKPSGYQDLHLTCYCPTESISKYHYLTYIHVPFQLHAGPLYCISLPSMSHLSSIQTLSHTQPGFKICISSASSSCPTLIKVRRILYHPHPSTISLSSRSIDSHFTSIQVVSEFHPGHPD